MGHQTLVNADVAAEYVRECLDRPCSPSTIYVWAHRGRIGRYGKERHRLYALEEVHDAASASRTTEILEGSWKV